VGVDLEREARALLPVAAEFVESEVVVGAGHGREPTSAGWARCLAKRLTVAAASPDRGSSARRVGGRGRRNRPIRANAGQRLQRGSAPCSRKPLDCGTHDPTGIEVDPTDLARLQVEDSETGSSIARQRSCVDDGEPAEPPHHSLVRMPVDDQRVEALLQLPQRAVHLERIALIVWVNERHIVGTQAVAEEEVPARRLQSLGRWPRLKLLPTRRRQGFARCRSTEISHLTSSQPALVVAANTEGVRPLKQSEAGVDVAPAVDDVADAEDAVDRLGAAVVERRGQVRVLRMDIADQSESHARQFDTACTYSGEGSIRVIRVTRSSLCSRCTA
jgi:hypothetical protein